jgi:hypothetical protein
MNINTIKYPKIKSSSQIISILNNTMECTEVLGATQGLCTVVIQSCANEFMQLAKLQIFTHKYSCIDMEDCATARY